MTPRAMRALKLLALVLVVSFLCLQPAVQVAGAATCGTACWQECRDYYFDCLSFGGTPAACCLNANRCASFCGSGCLRFC